MSSKLDVSVDLSAVGQALAADIRGSSSATGYFSVVLDELAVVFEKALTGDVPLSYEYKPVRG